MYRYLVSRLLMALPVLLGVSFITFLIIHLTPGDPARTILGPEARQEDVVALHAQLGLDDPVLVQYGRFLARAVRGDLGKSIVSRQPVARLVIERLPTTLLLSFTALLLGVVIAVPMGVVAAVRRGTGTDFASMGVALLGVSAPSFWIALMLIYLFSYRMQLFPATGLPPFSEVGFEMLRHLILPALTLAVGSAALSARVLRSSMLEVLRQDYIRTARAKGSGQFRVVVRHALRNASIPSITVIGLQLGSLMGGAVVTETVFALPGVGRLAVDAISVRDFPLVQGVVLLVATSVTLINIVVDLLYGFLDPRISYD